MTTDWTVNGLAEETGMDRRTIKKILQNTAPFDIDGVVEKYKLADFTKALIDYYSGDDGGTALDRERVRKTSLEADLLEIEKNLKEGSVIQTDSVLAGMQNLFIPIRRAIWTSNMSKPEKTSLLNDIRNSITAEYFLGQETGGPAAESGAEVP